MKYTLALLLATAQAQDTPDTPEYWWNKYSNDNGVITPDAWLDSSYESWNLAGVDIPRDPKESEPIVAEWGFDLY